MTPEHDRVFLDSNVLFASAFRPGTAISRLWRLPDMILIVSEYVVGEVRKNLPSLFVPELERLLPLVMIIDDSVIEVRELPPGVNLPAKDIRVLQAAIGVSATHFLTGDKNHFGRYYFKTIGGVLIIPPAAYRRSG